MLEMFKTKETPATSAGVPVKSNGKAEKTR
jgi:hypothetical protein